MIKGFRHSARLAWLVAISMMYTAAGHAQQTPAQPESVYFNVKQVVPGVWAFIVKPGAPGLATSNAAVIELGDRLMIVDSHLTPAAAREAARLAAALTGNKPVRYLVNTHWHLDHIQGNAVYASAFPGAVDIISHANTRRDILALAVPFLKDQQVKLPKQIAEVKAHVAAGMVEGKPMPVEQKRRLEGQLNQAEALLAEITNLEVAVPNITFDRSLVFQAGGREVRLLYFGRGNTEGDAVVFLPKEKVLLTGDLLTNSIPLMSNAYPLEWSQTLAGVEALDYTQNIPGHGDVQQGKERLQMLRAFLDDLIPAVRRVIAEGKSLDDAKKTVKAELAPRHEKNFPSWNGAAEASVERAYSQMVNTR